ncbi:MAG: hemolysin family protein [Acidimicrobiales bacterium]|nr:hemolysin family protein [Acidimicrobiales bacterium]
MSIWSGLLIAALLLSLNAFFVAAEFSLVAVNRASIEAEAENGYSHARRVRKLLQNLLVYLSGAQFGITLSALSLGFVAEPTVAKILTGGDEHSGLSVFLAVVVATSLHLVIGEQIPKYLALAAPRKITFLLAPFIQIYGKVFYPVVAFLNYCANRVVNKLGIEPKNELSASHTLGELENLIETSGDEGVLDSEEVNLLRRSIRFTGKTVADVLVPRVEVRALQKQDSVSKLVDLSVETGFSRFPVFGIDLDDIQGVVHVKSLYNFPIKKRFSLSVEDLMNGVSIVPETRDLDDVLYDIRQNRNQLLVVADEHGGTAGIVSIEDVLEEIVGEIGDEYDDMEIKTRAESLGSTIISGRLNLYEVEESTGLKIPEGPYETIAGYVLFRLGHLPEPSEIIEVNSWKIEVVAVEGLRVANLRVVSPNNSKTRSN